MGICGDFRILVRMRILYVARSDQKQNRGDEIVTKIFFGKGHMLSRGQMENLNFTHNKALLSQPAAAGTAHCVVRPKARR
jgi:hypothetical protein